MPRKADELKELYPSLLASLTYSLDTWRGFLRTAAYQYKYAFPDQVLIYAQRPNATACAEMELWNKTFGRWVNRNARGIALITESGTRSGVRYVFDVADTHSRYGQEFSLWELKDAYRDDVLDALESRYGISEETDDLPVSIVSACKNAVQDNMPDYLSDLMTLTENSRLEGLDEDNVSVRFQPLLEVSVAYTVLTRLGMKAEIYLEDEDFDNLRDFNTAETINLLGSAVGDISEILLRDMERTVKNCEKEIRTFDEKSEIGYNTAGKENQTGGANYK